MSLCIKRRGNWASSRDVTRKAPCSPQRLSGPSKPEPTQYFVRLDPKLSSEGKSLSKSFIDEGNHQIHQILAACPWLVWPTWTTCLPIALKSGSMASTVSAAPPTMKMS